MRRWSYRTYIFLRDLPFSWQVDVRFPLLPEALANRDEIGIESRPLPVIGQRPFSFPSVPSFYEGLSSFFLRLREILQMWEEVFWTQSLPLLFLSSESPPYTFLWALTPAFPRHSLSKLACVVKDRLRSLPFRFLAHIFRYSFVLSSLASSRERSLQSTESPPFSSRECKRFVFSSPDV